LNASLPKGSSGVDYDGVRLGFRGIWRLRLVWPFSVISVCSVVDDPG
jgi:hypothetical protein